MPTKKTIAEQIASKAGNAYATGQFVKVTDQGTIATGLVKGSGIKRQLAKADKADWVYVLDARAPLAGRAGRVNQALALYGLNLQSVQHVSAANLGAMDAVVNQLAAKSSAMAPAKAAAKYTVTLQDLVQAALNMDAVKLTWPAEPKKSKKAGSKPATPRKSTSGAKSRSKSGGAKEKKSLAERVATAAKNGKVVNVGGKNLVAVEIGPGSRVVAVAGVAAMPDNRAAMVAALNELGQGGRIAEWDMLVAAKKSQPKKSALPAALPPVSMAPLSPRRTSAGLPRSPSRARASAGPLPLGATLSQLPPL